VTKHPYGADSRRQILQNLIQGFRDFLGFALRLTLEDWLGGPGLEPGFVLLFLASIYSILVHIWHVLLHVRRAYYRGNFGPPKNHASERDIPIAPGILYSLSRLKEHGRQSSTDLAFPNAAGHLNEAGALLNRVLYPTLASLGLPRTGWRAFRRSAATALSEMREPVRTTQQVLGHSSPNTTLAFYVQSVEGSQRRAISSLERILFPNVPDLRKALG